MNRGVWWGEDDKHNPKLFGSNWGKGLDLTAPGVDITLPKCTTLATGPSCESSMYWWSGTSFAAPLVTAAAAMLLDAHPTWTPADVAYVLKATAQDLGPAGYDTTFGSGLLRIDRALSWGNRAPSATDGAQGLRAGQTHTRSVTSYVTANDTDTIRYELVETGFARAGFGFSWNSTLGTFTMTVPAGSSGQSYLKFRAIDPYGASSRTATVQLDFVA